jgi:hypothetical protein
MSRVIPLLPRLKGFFLDVLHPRCVRWTRPLTLSLPLGTLRDLGRSKSELTAENVLLRQRLVLLARFGRTWRDLATEGLHIPAVTMADRLQMLWERENHPMF